MRYPTLDLVRGLGAVAVVLFHMGLVWHIAPYGYLAVDVFFCLSGYVMAMTYELDLRFGMRPTAFLALRLRRLYPTYLVGILLGLLVVIAKGIWLTPWAFLNVLMLPAPVTSDFFPLNVPAWSLFFELIAYVCFAFCPRVDSARLWFVVIVCAAVLLITGGIGNDGAAWNEFPLGLARLGFAYPLGWLLWRHNFRPPPLPDGLVKPALWLGAISYPLYVIHYPLLSPLQLAARRLDLGGPLPALAMLALLLTAAWVMTRPWPRIRLVRIDP